MNDYRNIPFYTSQENAYELVWFEDRQQWFISCVERGTDKQTWSAEGYETPRDAQRAFDGCIAYVNEPPGRS